MKKRILAVFLCLVMVICSLPSVTFADEVETSEEIIEGIEELNGEQAQLFTQNKTAYFNKSYTLTGNPAKDLVNVAKAQLNVDLENIYTEAWCANFVTDCARLTGMSDSIIPYNYASRGACRYLIAYMKSNCGAVEVTSPQEGDLVFYYCSNGANCGNYYPHVGIVMDSSTSIEGNYSDKVSIVNLSSSFKHSCGTSCTREYIRPNYGDSTSRAYALDEPTDNAVISGETFRILGWVAGSDISKITYKIDDGTENEIGTYWRDDVQGMGYQAIISSYEIPYGTHTLKITAYLNDGTSIDAGQKTLNHYNALGWDYPSNNADITEDTFLVQGWLLNTKSVNKITAILNNGESEHDLGLYTREDVPGADAFMMELDSDLLNEGSNIISLKAYFDDGTSELISHRTITASSFFAYDYPQDGSTITGDTFAVQCWTKTFKSVDKVTCTINGANEFNIDGPYYREDINGNGYLSRLSSYYLSNGANNISIKAYLADGTIHEIGQRTVYRYDGLLGWDFPQEDEKISGYEFIVQGWWMNSKDIEKIVAVINEDKEIELGLYTREDVPDAIAFRGEIKTNELNLGDNSIILKSYFTDGSTEISYARSINCIEIATPTPKPTATPTPKPTATPTPVPTATPTPKPTATPTPKPTATPTPKPTATPTPKPTATPTPKPTPKPTATPTPSPTVTPTPTVTPAPTVADVTNLIWCVDENVIMFAWDGVSKATDYAIYDGDGNLLAITSNQSWSTSVDKNGIYTYVIKSVIISNGLFVSSDGVSVVIPIVLPTPTPKPTATPTPKPTATPTPKPTATPTPKPTATPTPKPTATPTPKPTATPTPKPTATPTPKPTATPTPKPTATPTPKPAATPTPKPTVTPTPTTEPEYAYTITDLSAESGKVKVSLTNNFGEGGKLIVVSYDKDGRLVGISFKDFYWATELESSLNMNKAAYITAFVWDDFMDIKPISNEKRIDL